MSTPYPGDDPRGEEDPTGVRSLLSSLPEPGPMPEHLVARITQSLAQEQERRDFQEQLPGAPLGSSDTVISLAAERNARRPGRTLMWLGSAAAAAVAVTVAVSQLFGGGGTSGDTAANIPNNSSSQGAGRGDSAQPAPGGVRPTGDAQGEAEPKTPITLSPVAASLSSDDVQQELTRWAAKKGTSGTTGSATASSSGATGDLSTAQAQRCLDLIPGLDGTAYTVGRGTLDDTVPVVAVVQTAPEPAHGWVLSADCTTGGGEVLLPRQRQG